MSDSYTLSGDGKTPIKLKKGDYSGMPCAHKKMVMRTHIRQVIPEDVFISTVFLGLDHNMDMVGPPVLWETMIFGGKEDAYCDRYTSYNFALLGHIEAVKLAIQKPEGEEE